MQEPPLHGVTFRFIETNGIPMRIATMGNTGPLVLFAHGWPRSWCSKRHQIPALANAGYRVVVAETRGYGRTDVPAAIEAHDIITLAADMVGIVDALGEEEATIVGHDWGAPVAAHSALLFPTRFSSLVLMSVPYGGRGTESPMHKMRGQLGVNYYRNIERNWEITEHLTDAKIEVPTLFLAGEKDVVIGGATRPTLQSMMAQTVADLRDVILMPDIGHWVQQEAPEETNSALLDFLASS